MKVWDLVRYSHEIRPFIGDTIQTASFMRQQKEHDPIQPIWVLKVGIQEKAATGMAALEQGRKRQVAEPYTKPCGSWASAGNSPALNVK